MTVPLLSVILGAPGFLMAAYTIGRDHGRKTTLANLGIRTTPKETP